MSAGHFGRRESWKGLGWKGDNMDAKSKRCIFWVTLNQTNTSQWFISKTAHHCDMGANPRTILPLPLATHSFLGGKVWTENSYRILIYGNSTLFMTLSLVLSLPQDQGVTTSQGGAGGRNVFYTCECKMGFWWRKNKMTVRGRGCCKVQNNAVVCVWGKITLGL